MYADDSDADAARNLVQPGHHQQQQNQQQQNSTSSSNREGATTKVNLKIRPPLKLFSSNASLSSVIQSVLRPHHELLRS